MRQLNFLLVILLMQPGPIVKLPDFNELVEPCTLIALKRFVVISHPHFKRLTQNALCNRCNKKDHFHNAFNYKNFKKTTMLTGSYLSTVILSAATETLSRVLTTVPVNGTNLRALVDIKR